MKEALMRKARPLIRAGYLSLGPGPDDTSCHLALSRCKINHFSNITATFMPKSSFICKKSGPAPILSPDPLLFLVYQIAQPYKKTQAVSRLTKSHSKSSVSATLSLHPSLGGRPWLGECFLWFVSFAPKEMNESFCFFSKRRLLILIHPSILCR